MLQYASMQSLEIQLTKLGQTSFCILSGRDLVLVQDASVAFMPTFPVIWLQRHTYQDIEMGQKDGATSEFHNLQFQWT